ncbi:unnamed protein product [Durusdinium trenchii]|uniref:HTH La-type RNA-binding domain-containing protein n=1 Tax=Durusdinium trenchii TaxID=1381693 RepID=A0ABP0S7D7_9DINO
MVSDFSVFRVLFVPHSLQKVSSMSVSTVYDDVVASVFEEHDATEDPYFLDVDGSEACEDAPAEDGEPDEQEERQPQRIEEAPEEQDGEHHQDREEEEASNEEEKKIVALAKKHRPRAIVKHRPKRRPKRPREASDVQLSEEETAVALRRQIEYYFSDENLKRDSFFHEKISANAEGWLDSSWILGCKRVKKLGVTADSEIEAALQESELETQWISGDGDESPKMLQVRRELGKALPELGPVPVRCLRPGWLAQKIEGQRQSKEVDAAAAMESHPEPAPVKVPAVGELVKLIAGEHSGQDGQVLAIDGEELTLLVGGADVVIASVREIQQST